MFDNPTLNTLEISYDLGADSEIPAISKTGIIVVSVFLGLDVLALFLMALYACFYPRWTDQRDGWEIWRRRKNLGGSGSAGRRRCDPGGGTGVMIIIGRQ